MKLSTLVEKQNAFRRKLLGSAVATTLTVAALLTAPSASADGNCVVTPNDPDATVATLRDVCTEAELRSLFATLTAAPMPTYGARAKGYFRWAVDVETARSLGVDTYLMSLVVWKGKVFYTNEIGGYLFNRMGPLDQEDQYANVYHGPYPHDNDNCIVVHYPNDDPTSTGSRTVRDYIRKVAPGVYLGLGLTPPQGLPTDNTHYVSFILDFNNPEW